MDKIKLMARVIDFERGIEELRVPGLYRYYNTSLDIGRTARLLETIRGQGKIEKTRLYDFGSQFGYTPDFVEKILIPKFVDRQFITDDVNSIDIIVTKQNEILDRCADDWLKTQKNPRDKLAIDILDIVSKRPIYEAELKDTINKMQIRDEQLKYDAFLTLEAINQLSSISVDNNKLYFNPEIIGENQSKLPDLYSKLSSNDFQLMDDIYQSINSYQGYPVSSLKQMNELKNNNLIESLTLCGILNPCNVQIGQKSFGFLFTGDILSSGKGEDPYHGIKEVTSHFRFAQNYANYKLHWLPRFLECLLRDKEAGRASPIGTDYKLLESRGVIEVKKLAVSSKYRMYLVEGKESYIEKTLDLINTNIKPIPPIGTASLQDQLQNIKVPPEARQNINVDKLNELVSRFMTGLRRTKW
jgi:hypothetical protein